MASIFEYSTTIFVLMVTVLYSVFCEEFCDTSLLQEAVSVNIRSPDYKKNRFPEIPTIIEGGFEVHEVTKVNELHRQWFDRRLVIGLPTECPNNQTIPINRKLYSSIWRPATAVYNAIDSNIAESPRKVETMTITKEGEVLYWTKMNLVLPCKTDYGKFPFDTITCDMLITTWVAKEFVEIKWLVSSSFNFNQSATEAEPVFLATTNIRLASFKVHPRTKWDVHVLPQSTDYHVIITMDRMFTYYILGLYVPNILTVLVAGSSFWYPADGLRVGLCISTLTALVFQYNNIAGSLPKVGYFKGIDLWMLTCFFFVVFALLEYTYLAYMKRLVFDDENQPLPWPKPRKETKSQIGVFDANFLAEKQRMTVKQFQNRADFVSRFVFMGVFLIFTVVYFVHYAIL